jgi:hypothetical protein
LVNDTSLSLAAIRKILRLFALFESHDACDTLVPYKTRPRVVWEGSVTAVPRLRTPFSGRTGENTLEEKRYARTQLNSANMALKSPTNSNCFIRRSNGEGDVLEPKIASKKDRWQFWLNGTVTVRNDTRKTVQK